MTQDRFVVSLPIVSLLETAGYSYVGCTPLDAMTEEGELCTIEYYYDWAIQLDPCFAVAHTPTGHYWMPWGDAKEDSLMVKKIIRAGNEISLERNFGGET